jgi:hypothetical protein
MQNWNQRGIASRREAAGAKIAEVTPNETRVFDVSNNHGDAMKTLNISLLASGIGTAVGLGA